MLRVLRVPLDYNVRFSLGKIYTYDVHLHPIADPFTSRFRFHPKYPPDSLDLETLSAAAAAFQGTHDFSFFSTKPGESSSSGARKKGSYHVRTIRRCRIDCETLHQGVRIEVEGDGFLYKQVRHMVGAMLAAATGRMTPGDIRAALEDPVGCGGGALSLPGVYVVAAAHGLVLKKVFLPAPPLDPDALMMYNDINYSEVKLLS